MNCEKCGSWKVVQIEKYNYICGNCGFEFTVIAGGQGPLRVDGEKHMSNTNPWDEASSGGKFVRFEEGEPSILELTEWKLSEQEKEFNGKKEVRWVLEAKCIKENGQACEKVLSQTAARLIKAIRPFLEPKNPATDIVTVKVLKVGRGMDTQFSVKAA